MTEAKIGGIWNVIENSKTKELEELTNLEELVQGLKHLTNQAANKPEVNEPLLQILSHAAFYLEHQMAREDTLRAEIRALERSKAEIENYYGRSCCCNR